MEVIEINELLEKMEAADTKELLVAAEDRIAGMIGRGFLEGSLDYGRMQEVKQQVEQLEQVKRKELGMESTISRIPHTR